MNLKLNCGRLLFLAFLVMGMTFGLSGSCLAQGVAAPSKAELIKALDAILPLLEVKDFEAAAEHVLLPPRLKPEALSGLLEKRELSRAGIRLLEKHAKFGPATEIFGEERSKYLAEKMEGDVTKCFGLYYETEAANAEIIGQWDGSKFKLVRIDDVGKLDPAADHPAGNQAAPMKDASVQSEVAKPKLSREQIVAQAAQTIAKLEPIVASDPNDVDSTAKLAMAYNQIGNYPEAWKRLMAAFKVNPKHVDVRQGINGLVGTFIQRGVLSVGVPTETILGLMGEPRQKVELGKSRIRWVYGHWTVDFVNDRIHEIINLSGMTEEMFQPTETITTDLGGEPFRVGFRQKVNVTSLAHFFIPGEMISQFNQRITVERIVGVAENQDIETIAQKVIASEKKRWPGSSHKVIAKQADSVIVAVRLPAASGGKPWHQLVRLFKGSKDLHRLTYTLVQDDEPSQETQMKWLKIFQAASLNPVK